MKKLIAVTLGVVLAFSSINAQANVASRVVVGVIGGLVGGVLLKSMTDSNSGNSSYTNRYNYNGSGYSEEEYRHREALNEISSNENTCRVRQTYYQDSQGDMRPTGRYVRVCN